MDLKTFLENFDTIAEAPNGIQKLRSLILDLAIRGKLVPQNLEDEPASIILERIASSKKTVDKARKSRKFTLTDETETKKLFELPRSWQWAKLDELTSLITDGEHATPARVSYPEIPLGTAKNIRDGFLDFSNTDYVSSETAEKCWKRCKPAHNDILMVCVGATTGRLCLVKYPPDFVIVRSVALIRAFENWVYPEYIALAINSPIGQSQVWSNVKQSAQPCLYINKMQILSLPLPPLAEQKRIVEKVDELMALCDRLQAAKETRDNLRQKLRESAIDSLMNAETNEELEKGWAIVRDNWHDLSQDPKDVDDLRRSVLQLAAEGKLTSGDPRIEWKHSQLKSFCTAIQTGPFGSLLHASDYIIGGIPLINPQNIQNNQIFVTPGKTISYQTRERLNNYVLKENDVILARRGELGRCAVISESESGWLCGTGSLFIRLSSDVFPGFIKLWLDSPLTRKRLNDASVGSTMNNLNQKILGSLVISIPPIAEQKQIVAKVDELMGMCDRLEESLRQSRQRAEALAASAINHLAI